MVIANVVHNPFQNDFTVKFNLRGELVDEAGPFDDQVDAVDVAHRSGFPVVVGVVRHSVGNPYDDTNGITSWEDM